MVGSYRTNRQPLTTYHVKVVVKSYEIVCISISRVRLDWTYFYWNWKL